ncbi:MAG: diacylglycerol kinase family protein [Trueperaceae bacterium]
MLHIIHNPVAGRGRGRHTAQAVVRALAVRGVASHVWTTERPGHATELARALPRDAHLVAIGGDGTLHELVAACVDTERVVGIVPSGSGDDFAHALGLPRKGIEAPVDALIAGRIRTVDTGVCNGVPFVNAVGVGFDAEVGRRVVDAPRPLAGLGAYLWSVAVCLRDLRPAEVRLTVDGAPCFHGPSLLVSTQNGPRTGGSFRFAPAARIDDGVLEVVVAERVGRLGVLGLLPRVMVGRHLGHRRVRSFRGRSIEMRWDRPRAWHTEGEVHDPTDRLTIEVRPGSLRVFAP